MIIQTRTDIINALIRKLDGKMPVNTSRWTPLKYLEIGVANGENLFKIDCEYKIAVDPHPSSPSTYHLTSDEFFAQNTEKFDIVFIDGLHHADQVFRDIVNALNVLNEGGYIVCHDMNPATEEFQLVPYQGGGAWTGDCWKAFVELRRTRSDLEMYTINTDHGCAVIRKGKQSPLIITEEINYRNLEKNRKEWLNLIEVSEFEERVLLDKKEFAIPVIGVPIVNGVHWLKRLVESIDYPVNEVFVVNNNGRDQITEELDELSKNNRNPFVGKIRVCHLPGNLGVSGAFNLIIKSYITSPYWIISNNDLAFTPGFLKEMVEKASDPNVEIVWPPSINPYYVENKLGSFECFLFKSSVIEKCGLFDENFYPAYCEDCDYLAKIKCNDITSEYIHVPYYHGESLSWVTGSQTMKSESEEIFQKFNTFHQMNREYMSALWGSDWEDWSKYPKSVPTNTKYDLNFTRKKYLGF